jgi:hypothetical protein
MALGWRLGKRAPCAPVAQTVARFPAQRQLAASRSMTLGGAAP